MSVTVKNQGEFLATLESLGSGEVVAEEGLLFANWPHYELGIHGSDFDGGLPIRLMPAFVELQRTIYRMFARSVGKRTKELTVEERSQVDLIIRLEPGSTELKADFSTALNTLASKMTGKQALTAIVTIASLAAASYCFKVYFDYRIVIDGRGSPAEMTENESRMYGMVKRTLANQENGLASYQQDVRDMCNVFVQKVRDDDLLVFKEGWQVSGYDARKRRRMSLGGRQGEQIVEGDFKIQAVHSGNVSGGIRAGLVSATSQQKLTVTIPDGTLQSRQIRSLQEAEWEKKSLPLKIGMKQVGDRIVAARLLDVGVRQS